MGSSFIENLQKICDQRGLSISAVVERLGGSKSNITYWKKGSYPNGEFVIQLSQFLDVSSDFLLGLPLRANYLTPEERRLVRIFRNSTDASKLIAIYALQNSQIENLDETQLEEEKDDPSFSLVIPVFGRAAAGSPTEMIENIDFITVHDPSIKERDFAVIASGDSMIEEGIFDGDTVIVRKQIDLEHQGQLSLVAVGDSSTIKRYFITENGFMLRPANPLYENQNYSKEDDVRILGKIVKVINKKNV